MMNNIINNNTKHEDVGVYRVRARLTTPSESSKRRSIENIIHHAEVSEKVIEKYLVGRARLKGLPCLKYSNPNMVGYPDRLLVLPGGKVIWVELKSRGRKPTKIQQMRMAELVSLGHPVKVIDNKADIDELINTIKL